MPNYSIVIRKDVYDKAAAYKTTLENGAQAGNYLQKQLKNCTIADLTVVMFIEKLMNSKLPLCFAESEIYGNGHDWNASELSILGDINIVAPVTVYDNGLHSRPTVHSTPFSATLLFTAGALLRNGKHISPADWHEVTEQNEINPQGYYQLYERRLLPLLMYANDYAKKNSKTACITIPGLGCGQFAGPFRGKLGAELKNTLIRLLETHGHHFAHIKIVYFDPFQECQNERYDINGINFLVRPLMYGNNHKGQLCLPKQYQEQGDDFSDCMLFSVVAWDHVSWPGNDFYGGSRATDDGVKAAATSVMTIMTEVEGRYNDSSYEFSPPTNYENWGDVVRKNQLSIEVKDNFIVFD